MCALHCAQNRPDNFPSYPPDSYRCSDDVCLSEGGTKCCCWFCCCSHIIMWLGNKVNSRWFWLSGNNSLIRTSHSCRCVFVVQLPVENSTEKFLCCWLCTSGPISVSAQTDRRGYCPGQCLCMHLCGIVQHPIQVLLLMFMTFMLKSNRKDGDRCSWAMTPCGSRAVSKW